MAFLASLRSLAKRSGIRLMRHCSTIEKPNYEIRPMRRCDIQGLYDLTAENQWNMERAYLECIFNTDPSGLVVVVTDDGQVIGHNGILSHSDKLASSGMNIVKEQYRKFGIGRKLFKNVMDVMEDRNVGGTSLSNRVTFYAQFGWTIKSYTIHYNAGPVNPDFVREAPTGDFEIVPISDVSIQDFIAYDSEIHTVPRAVYICNWATWTEAKTYVALKSGRVCGYGVLRAADIGHRMYPLYADDRTIAHALFCKLAENVPNNESVIFSQPVENEAANEIIAANKFTTYLSMTRLYNKWNVPVDLKRVYSVSSTEYGIV